MDMATKSRRVAGKSQTDRGPHLVETRDFTETEKKPKPKDMEVQQSNDLHQNINGM